MMTVHAVPQMRHIGRVDHPGLGQPPWLIEAAEKADAFSEDEWDDVQLQLIDKSSHQALSGNVGTATDCRVAVTGCLLRGIDCRRNAVGDEGELDCAAWYRRRGMVSDHEMRHRVRRVLPATSLLSGGEGTPSHDDLPRGFDELPDHGAADLRRIEVPVVQARISTAGPRDEPIE